METLNTTEPHYIRCVKPNGVLKPGIFENFNVLQQLRCGVSSFWHLLLQFKLKNIVYIKSRYIYDFFVWSATYCLQTISTDIICIFTF